jgi:His/Glu/Gln/Arg/opine family amino acid ABC transporter permease subunit
MPAMLLHDLIGYLEQLLGGAVITVELAVSGYVLALSVGVTWALLRQTRNRVARAIVLGVWRVYASIFMSVPSVLVLFLFFFGGGTLVGALCGLVGLKARVDVSPFVAGLAALTIVQGAYSAEVVAGAIRNVPRGQFEAARALGIRPYQAWWYVILPQVARLALPGLVNIWVSVLKDTSLVALAGLNELVARSRTAAGATKEPFLFFIAAALFFIVFSSVTLKLSSRLERRLDRGTARPVAAGRGA